MISNTSVCSTCPYKLLGLCKALAFGQDHENRELSFIDARPRTPIVRANSPLNKVMFLCDGYAIQAAQLGDGRRQIISLRRPGQLLMGLETFAKRARFSAHSLTEVRVGSIPKDAFGKSIAAYPDSIAAFLKEIDQESRDQTDLLVDLGRLSAIDRLSHLICKFVDWYNVPIVNNQCAFRMLLRQEDIADFIGLTTTHVNRTMGALRRDRLIDLFEDKLRVLDFERLRMLVS